MKKYAILPLLLVLFIDTFGAEQSPETPFIMAFIILAIGTAILFKIRLKETPQT